MGNEWQKYNMSACQVKLELRSKVIGLLELWFALDWPD